MSDIFDAGADAANGDCLTMNEFRSSRGLPPISPTKGVEARIGILDASNYITDNPEGST